MRHARNGWEMLDQSFIYSFIFIGKYGKHVANVMVKDSLEDVAGHSSSDLS